MKSLRGWEFDELEEKSIETKKRIYSLYRVFIINLVKYFCESRDKKIEHEGS